MRTLLLKLAMRMLRFALRHHGWTDDERPAGFRSCKDFPWWKRVSDSQIQGNTLEGAIKDCLNRRERA